MFILIFNQTYLQASSILEETFRKLTPYSLIQLHQTKLDLSVLQTEVEKLIQQGFPLKRAREIYAQEQVAKVFEKKYKSALLPVSKVLEKIGALAQQSL